MLSQLATKKAFLYSHLGENDEVDYWQLKEMMCKPWLDAISQRMVTRRVNEDPSSGQEGFLAKWDKPHGSQILRYTIVEAGIAG